MMVRPFISYDIVYLSSKIMAWAGLNLMEYAHMFIQIIFGFSIIVFLISWMISHLSYENVILNYYRSLYWLLIYIRQDHSKYLYERYLFYYDS